MFQLPIIPQSLDDFAIDLQLPKPMLLPLLPSALEDLPIRKVEGAPSILQPILVLALISVPIRPRKHTLALDDAILPLAHIPAVIDVHERALPLELIELEVAFVDAGVGHVPALARFNALDELPLIVGAIGKLLLAGAAGDVHGPLPLVVVALVGVVVGSESLCIAVADAPLVHAPVVEYVAALALGLPLPETALVVRSVPEEELALSMHLAVLPLASVEA